MKKIIFKSLIFALLLTPFSGGLMAQNQNKESQTYILETPYDVQPLTPPNGKKVKNVILMIGDGMSLMHVYSAWTANRGKLNLDNSQVVGLSKTYCADKLITDSGASATAMATGHKTNYHYVGVDTEGKPLKTLIDLASAKGKSTGITVTCRLWDATPASFCCHNIDRDNETEIVKDYVNCNADYVFGGGAKLFENRKDGLDIFKELKNKGFQTPRTWDEVEKIKSGKVFAAIDSIDTPLPAIRKDLLARASLKGIELLNQNKNGFFMMIEGSQLDDYGHFNDLNLLMQEIHDFDRTIGKVYEWAAQDGETLVIVTADHETGGLTLIDGDLEKGKIVCKFSTNSHSGVMVPVYAFGPGSEKFNGIFENTAIFDKIKELLNL